LISLVDKTCDELLTYRNKPMIIELWVEWYWLHNFWLNQFLSEDFCIFSYLILLEI
jgi:hypothetical protein